MATPNTNSPQIRLLTEWLGKSRWTRLLLPRDFLAEVSASRGEKFTCRKTIVQHQLMRERTKTRIVKLKEAQRYSTNMNYRPTGFKSESLVLLDNATEVDCNKCKGIGILSCPTSMRCRECSGSGEIRVTCNNCGGSGRTGWDKEYDCLSCTDGTRKVRCGDCDRGDVVCDRCNGSGLVGCNQCDRAGKLVRADFVSRKFSSSTMVTFQLNGLSMDEFKNGLTQKHFRPLSGTPIYDADQTPTMPDVTRERKSIFSFDIYSQQYEYKEKLFFVNYITSEKGSKLVASKLPYSGVKIAASASLLCVVAVSAISAIILLA